MRTLGLTNTLEPELDVVTQYLAPSVAPHVAPAERFALARGSFALSGEVKKGRVRFIELQLPDDPIAAPAEEREAIARALLKLAFGFSVAFVAPTADLPDLYDELAVRAWLGLPPPPTAAEAHDAVLDQLAHAVKPDPELVGRALWDPRADELIAVLAAEAPPAESVPPGTRDYDLLQRVSGSFNAYEFVGPIAGYASAARRRFSETGAVPRTAAAARLCLFFEQRRRVHMAATPSEKDWRYFDALFEVLRSSA